MTTKVRKQIYLDRAQVLQLRQLASATGLSEAEIIRQSLNSRMSQATGRPRDLAAWERELHFIEEWRDEGSVEGGRTWKREDLYDR